ncbi:G patch domain and ankyrin repeat-containing protein 1 [Platysternon megacephalum]|uniref:G patch domain and ankyrin repeat-containing protein 1 n=1 Tax=Platysternon megacephalum TaxID=55544 RepID=A0A4D9DKJ4_9SAUR|nr:G patch domain and ankyrin repeat-containing protein 1 [Platysternon megacephalum]
MISRGSSTSCERPQAIPWGQLEKGDPVDVTDLLISHYREHYGVEVAVKVLRDIRQRQLAERLSRAGSINPGQESETKSDSEPGEKDGSNQCEESAIGQDPETELSQERRGFHDILSKLNLERHRSRKLRLSNLQEISTESIKSWTPHTLGDLPWHFLRKVMALSGMARNTSLGHQAPDEGISEDEEELDSGDNIFQRSDPGTTDSLNPLDVLCAVLLCLFCKVPCEADGRHHREHFASVHRPQSLQRFRNSHAKKLHYSLCSTDVLYNDKFQNSDTEWKPHPYKDYRDCYPDWYIQPDPSIMASDYWKFVFKEFNHQFAREYDALPADLPEEWGEITKEQALESIKKSVYDEIAQLLRKSV